ncbi:hypothetical protein P153DRAFT_425089 [Dothidotthia symphoricarpi CBS 119687]|uniref:Rhodopsin domain-containing protein n=1 Tax=Dothidotthia symphoricarpi CBS 119687 TaxID=1392245 RepID=A0A6A6A3C0_9PLEO|nr:uncharacterized protein P153DRAFT_425089 [Dothidotthia symphoricarpi CBS 119687]KAF2126522.1 hypothetical protein P153DRAFT_425089 [Dothidotthia symphoricarpi CBS 119687]
MADTQGEWPNRRSDILFATVPISALATIFLIWRIVYGLVSRRSLLLCDYLLIIAGMMNVTTTAIRFKTTYHGQGRHMNDPSIKVPEDILAYSYFLWIGQVINLMAVAVLKYSICTWLLILKFSRIYTSIVWVSILLVTVFTFILPTLGVFSCTPFESNWNRTIEGKCFFRGNLQLAYAQGVTNVVTDLVYVVAPLLYLSTVQLPSRTQWGLRFVFCLGLVATACSVVKTFEMNALLKTHDPTWDGVNLSIWSGTELSVGILVASLPPLRKQIDTILRTMLPSTFMTKTRIPASLPMFNVNKTNERTGNNDDGDSDRHMLSGEEDGRIRKTALIFEFVERYDLYARLRMTGLGT